MKKKIIYSIAFALLLFSCNQEKDSENGNTEKVAEKSFSQTVNNGNVNFDKYFEDKTMRFDYFTQVHLVKNISRQMNFYQTASGLEAKQN
jgi:hypothetical protein